MCLVDSVFIMWAIGGAMLGWFGIKSWKKYKIRNQNTNSKPTEISNHKPTSLE